MPSGSIVPATLFHKLDDPHVRKIVDQWIDYLAIAVFNITAVADPECVLLGGGVCREQQLLPLVNAALDKIPAWDSFRTSGEALPPHQQRRPDRSLLRLRNRSRWLGESADSLIAVVQRRCARMSLQRAAKP